MADAVRRGGPVQAAGSAGATAEPRPAGMPPSRGVPLDEPARRQWAAAGVDVSHVRLHRGEHAVRAAQRQRALAYAYGQEIVLGDRAGPAVLAHEIAHTVQQRGGPPHIQRSADPEAATETDSAPLPDEEPELDVDAVSLIFFPLNSDVPRQDGRIDSRVHLDLALQRIAAHAAYAGETQIVEVHGYASEEGDAMHNLLLSQRRAAAVQQRLVRRGVDPAHVLAIPHGADTQMGNTRWPNRRVEIVLVPEVTQLDLGDESPLQVAGRTPRTDPVEPTPGRLISPLHQALMHRDRIPATDTPEWDSMDALVMYAERAKSGRSETLAQYKDRWVRDHAQVIVAAAQENDLPAWFLASVAWTEVGGDPVLLDDAGYAYRRDIGVGQKPALETSFGAVSIQVRRAAEELGYDPAELNRMQASLIIDSLRDPQGNLLIVARHLSRLRDIDAPGKPGALLDDLDLKRIGARYNRGAEQTLEQIDANLGYGKDIVKKRERLEGLLAE